MQAGYQPTIIESFARVWERKAKVKYLAMQAGYQPTIIESFERVWERNAKVKYLAMQAGYQPTIIESIERVWERIQLGKRRLDDIIHVEELDVKRIKKGQKIFLDLETTSEIDLKKCGSYLYSKHPSTQILLCCYSIDGHNILTGIPAISPNDVIVAYNAEFEYLVLKNVGMLDIRPEQMFCVMSMASPLGFNMGLDKLGRILNVEHQKLSTIEIKKLMEKLKTKSQLSPEEFTLLEEYCKLDVLTMIDIHTVLDSLSIWNQKEIDIYHMTIKINEKGIPIDGNLILLAREKRDWAKNELSILFKQKTLQLFKTEINFTQLKKLKQVLEIEGIKKSDWEYISQKLENDLPKKEIFEIYKKLKQENINIIEQAFNYTDWNNLRMHNCFIYHGAHDGRWSSKGFKIYDMPQNCLGKTDSQIISQIQILKDSKDPIEILDILNKVKSHFFYNKEKFGILGYRSLKMFTSFALSNIDFYGNDIYREFAAKLFTKPLNSITNQDKVHAELIFRFSQYQISAKELRIVLKNYYNLTITDAESMKYIEVFYKTYSPIVKEWYRLEKNAKQTLKTKQQHYPFEYHNDALILTLPSGREIGFWNCHLSTDNRIVFTDNMGYPSELCGGRLYDFLVKGTARDLMAFAMLKLKSAVALFHDEIIIEDISESDSARRIMEKPVEWLPNIHLEVRPSSCHYFYKF